MFDSIPFLASFLILAGLVGSVLLVLVGMLKLGVWTTVSVIALLLLVALIIVYQERLYSNRLSMMLVGAAAALLSLTVLYACTSVCGAVWTAVVLALALLLSVEPEN